MDITLCLTHDCNLRCSYCYAGDKKSIVMSEETTEKALDFAFSFGAKDVQLGFFGGEPLLEWELLKKSTLKAEELAEKNNIKLKKTVTTNCTLVSEEKLLWLKEHDFYVGFSIDGNRAMHEKTRPFKNGCSSFDACIKGLETAVEIFPFTEVIVVPDPSNVEHLADSVEFLIEEKKVYKVAVNPNFYTEWPSEKLDILDKNFERIGVFFIKRFQDNKPLAINFINGKIITRLKEGFSCTDRCNFGEKSIAVAVSGNIYPCERLVGNDDDKNVCIGNIFKGFDEEKRQSILAQRGNINHECLECCVKHRCMNWCGCINYAMTGAINTTDGLLCHHERLAIKVADRVGNTLFEEKNPLFLNRFYYEDFSDIDEFIN